MQVKFAFCLAQWKQITIDEEILKMVEGVDIDFAELPVHEKPTHNHIFSTEQIHAIDLEVSELLKKGVIRKAHHSNKEYISPIFVRPKKDNRWRMILNLKELNKNVEYFHFKTETLKNALALVKPNFFCVLTGPERCIFFSTCKPIFTGKPKVLLRGSALHAHSFFQWITMLPKIIHKIVETSYGPSSYARLCVSHLY